MGNETDDREQEALEALEKRFVTAVTHKDQGRLDDAEDEFRDILRAEPRLPEPRMELARLLLDTDRLDEAEEHAREALGFLEAGGQWTDDLSEEAVLGLAHALLAEILRRRAEDDTVIFGDPQAFQRIVTESREHFERAAALDPSDEYSSYHAFFMGKPGVKPSIAGETLDDDPEDDDPEPPEDREDDA